MLELKNLSYCVRNEDGTDLTILNNISLTIEDNKLVVFTGPNGGGKTTLARAIMGLIREYDLKSKGIDSGQATDGELLKELLLKIFVLR